ncbi:hypothetical protein T459_28740 [Capsicum annuum]|uniref:Disease resistance RPP13-like protein 1 n=1 Tax=Capsicum annuum TaxID=4072 RepID=A0A2G2YHL9_CAPAN|nr:hypothetical protein T459_28740 [Capsicum annuum]
MEIGLAVGGAFLSSALNVFFDRLAPHGDLLNMFQKHKHDDGLLEKLEGLLLDLQVVLSDAENKQASDQCARNWLNKLQIVVDGAENLLEEVNYEALRLKVEGQHQNLAETSNQQNEMEQLIDHLTSKEASEKNLTVLPIVGMGGMGKTTLAQAAYNDEKVQSHFKLKAWICVSETYDAFRISKGLLQAFNSFDLKDDNNLDQLQVKLKESLKGERFLIVLDDMWNENYNQWKDLWNIFVQGGIPVERLVEYFCSRRHAFENMDPREHPELEEVAKKIAAKCKGLPLALKTLAGMLLSESEVEVWRRILTSEIWDLDKDNDILPALMLSYNELPPHLKPCFSYCTIFPKDYPFRKEQVIHLWIANGLVVPQGEERIQDLGDQFFNQLEECQGSHSRHLSYSMGIGGDFEKLTPLNKFEQLRTLLPIFKDFYRPNLSKRVLHNILPRLTSLRALSLSHYRIKELPDALFIKLKLLRFLDLSWTKITKLPDSICALYNLETLLLSSCDDLEELPPQMENLTNLRHLEKKNNHVEKLSLEWSESDADSIADNSQTERDILDELRPHTNIKEVEISGYRGTQFPNWLADLSFLKLVKLSVRNCKDCFSLPALGQLPCLKFLSIRKMHRITEIRRNSMVVRPPIKFLTLLSGSSGTCPELNLETPIQLSRCLKRFEVDGSPKAGVVFDEAELFTSQLEGMKQIEKLDISDCISLTSFPLSTLPSTLKRIRIRHCRKLKLEAPDSSRMNSNMFLEELELDECDSISSPELVPTARYLEELLPSLKELRLWNCPEIESFPDGGLPFNLQLLWINNCEKLVNGRKEWRLQRLPSLRELEINHNGSDEEIVGGENWALPCSIPSLTIDNLKTLSSQLFRSLTSLESLDIRKLPQIQSLLEQGLPSLSEQCLYHHDELHSLPTEGLRHLTSLQRLEIRNCPQLQSLAESVFPSSLSKLTIRDCPNLQSLPINYTTGESASGTSSLAYFVAKDKIDHINTIVQPAVYLSMFYFFSDPRSSSLDNYLVLLCVVHCVTGIAYALAIYFEPGQAQLWSVLLPVVLTLVASKDSAFMSIVGDYIYSKWALEAFIIANAKRYSGVWLITRCGVLMKRGFALDHWKNASLQFQYDDENVGKPQKVGSLVKIIVHNLDMILAKNVIYSKQMISEMEIGLAVGGAFLSSALNVLFDRLAPHGDLLNMFQKNKHDVRLLKKLKMTLVGLQALLSDAENKQASNQHSLRLKVEGQLRNLAETSNQQVSDLNLSLSDDYFLNVKEKLEETIETLEDLQKQIGLLGLKEHFALTKQETRRHSTSLVDESDVFGRQNEIEELIDHLLSKDASEKSPAVVPIVGMGGVGKTTLGKAAYNDEKVQSHFNLTAWFCVSEPYDAFRITKGLLQQIGSLQVDDNLNQLQVKLKESLKGKRFLIVLDDMWNENYNEWNDLWNVFVQGGIGSKIIVTTRKESVALMMQTEQISMDTFSIDDSWSLFKRHAFENMDPMEHPELEEVGKQIVAKCKGLPLALKTLTGMLRSKSELKGGDVF